MTKRTVLITAGDGFHTATLINNDHTPEQEQELNMVLNEARPIKNIIIEGQDVLYRGKKTYIEVIHNNHTCNIANPYWNWDEEASDSDYDVPYWITVKLSELKLL
jgi:hypothetical protein